MSPAENAAVRQVPSGLVTLTTLSSQLGFLPPSPAWPEVERAMARMIAAADTAMADPEGEQDARLVQAYAGMLNDRIPFLTMLLLVAIVIGRLGTTRQLSTSRSEQLLRGLQAIKWAIDAGGIEYIDHLMDPLWVWARSEAPSVGSVDMAVERELGLDRWAGRIGERLELVESEIVPTSERLEEARRVSWDHWRGRMRAFLGFELEGQPIGPNDLLCHAAHYAPSAVFPTHLKRMTVVDWSRLVYVTFGPEVSRVERVRPWLGEAAVRALGFAASGAEFNSLPQRRPQAPGILVVRRERDSQVVRWPRSETLPVVAWTWSEVAALADAAPRLGPILSFPGPPTVAVEVPHNTKLDLGVLSKLLGGEGPLVTFSDEVQQGGNLFGLHIIAEQTADLVRAVEEFRKAPTESEVSRSARQIRGARRKKK